MASDRRSILMLRPSSSRWRFSSRVPKRVSILGLMSILFFIQVPLVVSAPSGAVAQCALAEISEVNVTCRRRASLFGLYFATWGGQITVLLKAYPGYQLESTSENRC